MQFDHLRIHDAVLAILIAFVAMVAGASYRHVQARRFVLAAPAPAPAAVADHAASVPSPPPPARVITKLPGGATVFDHPGSTARPVAQIKPGAVVEVSVTDTSGWLQLRSQAGTAGWVSAASLAAEAASSASVALFDSVAHATGAKLAAARAGALYSSSRLAERIGGFLRGERVEILRNEGKLLLVGVPDGAGGRVVGYARTAEIRGWVAPPAAAPRPDPAGGSGDPLADGSAGSAGEPPAADPGDGALREAQDQYASGNFEQALARAEQAVALGSPDADVIAAMSACKIGDIGKARRHARRLRGAKLVQFRAACPEAQAPPPPSPAPVSDGSAPSPATPTSPAGDPPETP